MTDRLSRISLVVITKNEEDTIGRCLSSAYGVGEMIVVDSFSTDRTVETARQMGAQVHQREFRSAADQKNFGMEKAQGEWILILDADESLSPALRDEIAAAVSAARAEGYWLRRRNIFLGRRIRFCGWGQDRVLRLFKRGRGHYPERAVHERLELDGSARTLKGYLDHNPYRDINDYLERMNSYSRRGAEDLLRSGRKWFPAIAIRPAARFLRMYVLQLGFLDGMAGFLLCSMAATGVFYKYAYLRELSAGTGARSSGDDR
ncbi:MAG: glycosyltransferase family 2 protein [bacterium]|nr:MAG: glycosyltransferase family 2 protein [bacterium]